MTEGNLINSAGMAAAGPMLGLLYAALLPFIGIAVLLKVSIQKALDSSLVSAGSASFSWRPGESYLTGKKKK